MKNETRSFALSGPSKTGKMRRCQAAARRRRYSHSWPRDKHSGKLLRRAVDGAIELVVLTLWESMGAVRKFAGVEPGKAFVEPEARAILTSFDDSVTHFEVVHCAEGTAK
jgi:hypothetical protein